MGDVVLVMPGVMLTATPLENPVTPDQQSCFLENYVHPPSGYFSFYLSLHFTTNS